MQAQSSGVVVLERGPYGPTKWECPDCEGSGEIADPCCQGATGCEECDGMGTLPTWEGPK